MIEVCHVAGRGAPLEMTGETKNGAQSARSYDLGASGLKGPGYFPFSTLFCVHLLELIIAFHQFGAFWWLIRRIIGDYLGNPSEAFRSRFDPGNILTRDVNVYFKIYTVEAAYYDQFGTRAFW
jgi:hypothetical protein